MTEAQPPLAIEAEGVRVEPRKTGNRLLDMSVAFSAILISLISLFVAMRHGETQERMLAATSWPILQLNKTNYQNQSQTIALQLNNNGVGPALVHYVVLRHAPSRAAPSCCAAVVTSKRRQRARRGLLSAPRPRVVSTSSWIPVQVFHFCDCRRTM